MKYYKPIDMLCCTKHLRLKIAPSGVVLNKNDDLVHLWTIVLTEQNKQYYHWHPYLPFNLVQPYSEHCNLSLQQSTIWPTTPSKNWSSGWILPCTAQCRFCLATGHLFTFWWSTLPVKKHTTQPAHELEPESPLLLCIHEDMHQFSKHCPGYPAHPSFLCCHYTTIGVTIAYSLSSHSHLPLKP